MRINYISGNTIIGRIYDEFNIKSSDWVNRVPDWIYQALRQLNNNKTYVNMYFEGKFYNNHINLPEYDGEIKLLTINHHIIVNPDNIEFHHYYNHLNNDPNNQDLPIVSDNNTFNSNNSLSRDESLIPNNINTNTFWKHKKDQYYIENNILYTRHNTGHYKLWYKTIPVDFNDKLQTYIPNIPDIEKVISNIKWYVFKNILSRGLIHPVYSLGNRNPEYDPNAKWQTTLMGAKLALSELDNHDRNELANVSMAFFNLPSYKTGQVDNIFELFKPHAV